MLSGLFLLHHLLFLLLLLHHHLLLLLLLLGRWTHLELSAAPTLPTLCGSASVQHWGEEESGEERSCKDEAAELRQERKEEEEVKGDEEEADWGVESEGGEDGGEDKWRRRWKKGQRIRGGQLELLRSNMNVTIMSRHTSVLNSGELVERKSVWSSTAGMFLRADSS